MMIFPFRILFFLLFFQTNLLLSIEKVGIAQQEGTVQIIIPQKPLAKGSVQIKQGIDQPYFSDWSDLNHRETQKSIQRIIEIWEESKIDDYLVYGKEDGVSQFSWEIVPYPKKGNRLWKQFKVLWNITFGASSILPKERERQAEDLRQKLSQISHIGQETRSCFCAEDPFCNPTIIERQLLFEGKEINLLYSHAPIASGKEKLHFLIAAKKHRIGFPDLTGSEYLEAMQLSQQLIDHYREKGFETTYLFHQTGQEAGQNIPHWIMHVVFAATKTQEFLTKLTILKNMLLGLSPMPEEEFLRRVKSLREELGETLPTPFSNVAAK